MSGPVKQEPSGSLHKRSLRNLGPSGPRGCQRERESAIVSACMLVLSRAGALVQRNNSGLLLGANGRRVRAAMPGAADIIACYHGVFLAVECKTRRGVQSDAQRRYQAAVELAGGIYVVIRDIEDLREAIAAIGC